VTRFRLRARCPSRLSVEIATTKSTVEIHRSGSFSRPASSRRTTNTGTSRIRTIVIRFGTLHVLTGPSPARSIRGFVAPEVLIPRG
jgi:hypothetical protein